MKKENKERLYNYLLFGIPITDRERSELIKDQKALWLYLLLILALMAFYAFLPV